MIKDMNVNFISRFFDKSLLDKISDISSILVSFSGGVDSSVVLTLFSKLIPVENICAVTFDSFLNFSGERDRGAQMCCNLGVKQVFVKGPELHDERVMTNQDNRCAVCKELRILKLLELKENMGFELVSDGTNGDDLKDSTRLGNEILARYPVFSPLAEAALTKTQVRLVAKEFEIPWWNESATACLATRFPKGYRLDPERSVAVGDAELALKRAGFKVRLRSINNAVCLELEGQNSAFIEIDRDAIKKILDPFGFDRIMVDIDGYKTGRSWP